MGKFQETNILQAFPNAIRKNRFINSYTQSPKKSLTFLESRFDYSQPSSLCSGFGTNIELSILRKYIPNILYGEN